MSAANLVGLGINLSIVLMVFGMALNAGPGRVRRAFRDPGLLLRSLVAMFVVMPAIAVLVAMHLDLSRPLLIALMLLALAPVPPILPAKQLEAGGNADYVLGLLVVSSLAAILVVPAGIEVIGWAFGRDFGLPLAVPARVVGISVLAPVLAGFVVARVAPAFAARSSRPVTTASSVLLFVLLVPLIGMAWDDVVAQTGNYTIVAIVMFVAVGLAVGQLLGGPDAGNRAALALATATRHPGVAIAVVNAVAPLEEGVAAAVLLYLVVAIVASIPFLKWSKRRRN